MKPTKLITICAKPRDRLLLELGEPATGNHANVKYAQKNSYVCSHHLGKGRLRNSERPIEIERDHSTLHQCTIGGEFGSTNMFNSTSNM